MRAVIAHNSPGARATIRMVLTGGDADGGAVPDANAIAAMWLDDGVNEANCGVDGAAETMIMGGAPGVGT